MTRPLSTIPSNTDPGYEDYRGNLVSMLTMALIWLTREGMGRTGHRSPAGYDPTALDTLCEMGLIRRTGAGASLEVTDHGLVVGEGAATIMADAFDSLFDSQEEPWNDAPQSLADVPRFNPLPYRAADDRRAFLLRVELDLEGLHPCWREVLVPATCTFLDLHIIIQRVFNWYDEHLFNFEMVAHSTNVHMEEYAFQVPEDACIPRGYALAEACEVLLGDIFPRSRTARYSYDYGDGWEHKVKLVKTLRNADATTPQLVAGEGDAPPEDVGGPGGFEDFLIAISNPFNEECLDALKWGEAQGYTSFELEKKQRELEECFEDDRRTWLEVLNRV